MKEIILKDWLNNKEREESHLKINKNFIDCDDIEVRMLLEKIVERLNFSIDRLYDCYNQQKETYEIIDGIIKNQKNLNEAKTALISLAEKTSLHLQQQSEIIQSLMKKS